MFNSSNKGQRFSLKRRFPLQIVILLDASASYDDVEVRVAELSSNEARRSDVAGTPS